MAINDTTVFLQYGDEKVSGTAKWYPLGTKGELPDGRIYRYARASATALVAGKLYQGKAGEANTATIKSLVPAEVGAVGDREINITIAGTALAADVYNDGYLVIASSIGTGVGHLYKIKSASSTTAGGDSTITFEGNDELKVALETSTTTVGLRKNPYDEVLLTTNNTVGVNTLAGVTAASAAASAYCWLQRRGPAAVFTDATTVIVGLPVVASSTVAGAVATPVITGTTLGTTSISKQALPVGRVMSVAASAEYSLIDLALE